MAIIPQKHLFRWEDVEGLGDLERLRLVLSALPDEPLMVVLEKERGHGRDDYPIRPMWNSLVAGVVFQHPSVAALRRELQRNASLRALCGFDPLKGEAAVPPDWAYTRFLRSLVRHWDLVEAMFDRLVEELRERLTGFGSVLAADGKGIPTHARPRPKDEERPEPDGRRDLEADWGVKTKRRKRKDGTLYEQVTKWFGYKLHLVVDAIYELPVAFEVTKASANEIPQTHGLVKRLAERHPEVLKGCEALVADKGDDDTKLITKLWDDHKIKPVIAIRDCWQDGEKTKRVSTTRNVVYDYEGTVSCVCMRTGVQRKMAYAGFEAKRGTLKYRCPARHYGVPCKGVESCPVRGAVRVKLTEDRRVFTPLARSSYAWKRTYAKRTAVERVNSRLDVSFGFERHFLRGQAKMRLRVGLALVVMLAMALGRIKQKQEDAIRCLVRAA
jgi:hypothetical protein